MTFWTLARRGMRFYLKSHLGTIFGAAIATAVLTGALLVGDSVRQSLRQMALARLGKIDFALSSGDRLFRDDLATGLQHLLTNSRTASALQIPGTISTPDGSARVNHAQVNGVDNDFWSFSNRSLPAADLSENSVWLNQRLASQLQVKTGDPVLIRVPRVSNLSRDAPLAPEEDSTSALRLEVTRILSDDEFGRFGLQASQVPPFNAFLPLSLLQRRVNATNQANLLLVQTANPLDATQLEILQGQLRLAFRPEDAQLQLRHDPTNQFIELRSPRVFLDAPSIHAGQRASDRHISIFTYFVNSLRHDTNSTPYSMVTASPLPFLPRDMKDDEILVNQWLAEDLMVKAGDKISISFYVMGLMRELIEKTNTFTIREILPMQPPYVDPSLMPDFPGITDADNCRDWDTGFPINTDAIRDKDEAYWDQYRGAPKAFITLAAGQSLWSNRFGSLTAIRYSAEGPGTLARVESNLKAALDPSAFGLVFQPVRAQAIAASTGAQDFGGLFIGFSFFLIASALMLMILMFRFGLEQRGVELGTLLAIGFPPKQVRHLLLLEGAGLALFGGLLGIGGGILYAKAMLYGLTTIWRDAIGASTIIYHASPQTIATGLFAGFFVALLTIGWSLRREGKRPARELLAGGITAGAEPNPFLARSRIRRNLAIGSICFLLAFGAVVFALMLGLDSSAQIFFLAGALLLISGLSFAAALIRRMESSALASRLSIAGMGVRNITRRSSRSRAAIALLACGAFLIASIGAFRLEAGRETERRSAGTGGFSLVGETAIPVVHNLNGPGGRQFFNLEPSALSNVSFVPFRVLEGEDASCLNLNRAQRPRLLGVDPSLLHDRKAFTFARTLKGLPKNSPWLLLERDFGPNIVPAIGDAASIQWALGKKLGDSLLYVDQQGRQFQVKIVAAVANSILQGNLIISEKHFVSRFPSESGYRYFLIDAPFNKIEALRATLSRAMQDVGLELTSARNRLAAFNAVQNTYLGTFQVLGGLGLLLGSLGLGIILLRNVFERRSEFALLLAVGFRKSSLKWMVLSEHASLLLVGLGLGLISATLAVLPAALSPGTQLPFLTLGLSLGGVITAGLIWTLIASIFALKAPLIPSLRNE